jgi:glycosyltransferase involved in cell wall biosynthesis
LCDQGTSVVFAIVGGGVESERLKARAEREVPEYVSFQGYRHPKEMAAVFSKADALLVHLRKDPLFEITIPSKTQAYLAVGKPILMGVQGDAAELVKQAGAGILFEPESPESLAKAIMKLITLSKVERDRMGKAGAEYYNAHLSFDVGIAKIEQELEKAINK